MRQVAIRPASEYNQQKAMEYSRWSGSIKVRAIDSLVPSIFNEHTDREEYFMNDELASQIDDRMEEGAHTWDSVFGRRRFRAQWHQGPGYFRFHIQKPFPENDDPDGKGVPFSPDLGCEWEDGQGVRLFGEHGEYVANLEESIRRAGRWAARRARSYAVRTLRNIPARYWGIVQRDVSKLTEEEKDDLEEALTHILREWNSQQAESQSPERKPSPEIQRVPIERDESYHPFDDDSSPV
jgi:hypothetical protein